MLLEYAGIHVIISLKPNVFTDMNVKPDVCGLLKMQNREN
jgi:hypothetical protein